MAALVRTGALLGLFLAARAQCGSDEVASRVLSRYPAECVNIEDALDDKPLITAEWKLLCTQCAPVVGATFFDQCALELWAWENVQHACGVCTPSPAVTETPPEPCPPCTCAPDTIAPSPELLPSPDDGSGSGASVDIGGPISTVFIVSTCLILCAATFGIWFRYVRKTSKEKIQEAKLQNFNLLDVQPTKTHKAHPLKKDAPPALHTISADDPIDAAHRSPRASRLNGTRSAYSPSVQPDLMSNSDTPTSNYMRADIGDTRSAWSRYSGYNDPAMTVT